MEKDVALSLIALLIGLAVLLFILRAIVEPSRQVFASPEKIQLRESPETLKNRVTRCIEAPTKIRLDNLGFSYGKDAKFYVVFFYQGYVSLGDKPIEFKKESAPTVTLESGPFSAVTIPRDQYVTIAFMTEYSECISLAKEDPETKTNMKAEQFLKRCGAYIVDTLPPFPVTSVSCAPSMHTECINNACVTVVGFGPNRCRLDFDCQISAYACLQSDTSGNPIGCVEENGFIKLYASEQECKAIGSGCHNIGQSCVPAGQCPAILPTKDTACFEFYANRCLADASGAINRYTTEECQSFCTPPRYLCIKTYECP